MSYYTTPCTTTTTYALGSIVQGTISGSYVLLEPQTITMPPISVKNVGTRIAMPGTGKLYVYIVYLPANVTVFVNVNGIDVPLKAGSNEVPVPGNVKVGPITIINNNEGEVSISMWAFLAE